MKCYLYLSLLIVAACGVKHTSIDYGKTTRADLLAQEGEPIKTSKPIQEVEIYEYQENTKFQLEGDVVTHGFKDPKGDEKLLLYWKHRFKDCGVMPKKISEQKGHDFSEYELKCPAEGITVIYTEGSEFVSRIIEHEKK